LAFESGITKRFTVLQFKSFIHSILNLTKPFVLLSYLSGLSGQIQSVAEPAARATRDGSARRGLPLLQAHARKRTHTNAAHGNAAR